MDKVRNMVQQKDRNFNHKQKGPWNWGSHDWNRTFNIWVRGRLNRWNNQWIHKSTDVVSESVQRKKVKTEPKEIMAHHQGHQYMHCNSLRRVKDGRERAIEEVQRRRWKEEGGRRNGRGANRCSGTGLKPQHPGGWGGRIKSSRIAWALYTESACLKISKELNSAIHCPVLRKRVGQGEGEQAHCPGMCVKALPHS